MIKNYGNYYCVLFGISSWRPSWNRSFRPCSPRIWFWHHVFNWQSLKISIEKLVSGSPDGGTHRLLLHARLHDPRNGLIWNGKTLFNLVWRLKWIQFNSVLNRCKTYGFEITWILPGKIHLHEIHSLSAVTHFPYQRNMIFRWYVLLQELNIHVSNLRTKHANSYYLLIILVLKS